MSLFILLCTVLAVGTGVVRQEIVPGNNTVCRGRKIWNNSRGEKKGIFASFQSPVRKIISSPYGFIDRLDIHVEYIFIKQAALTLLKKTKCINTFRKTAVKIGLKIDA